MHPRALRVLYEVLAATGLNPALAAADVPDTRLMELVEGANPIPPGRALDLGCGTGRNTLYLARHGWYALGIDMLGRAIDTTRSRAVGAAASARFVRGDVTRLSDLGIGDGYHLIVDSGCYYGLSGPQRGLCGRRHPGRGRAGAAADGGVHQDSRCGRRDQRLRSAPKIRRLARRGQCRGWRRRNHAAHPHPIPAEGGPAQRPAGDPPLRAVPYQAARTPRQQVHRELACGTM